MQIEITAVVDVPDGTPKGWSRATQAQTDGVLACMTK